MEARRERIAQLSRVNRGTILRPGYLAKLSAAFGMAANEQDLLDLARTDSVRSQLNKGYAIVREDRQPSFHKYYHTKESEYCGAILSEASKFLKRAKEIIDLDGDSLNILSADDEQGLILDRNPDEVHEHYELAVWGDRWPLAFL